MTLTSELLTPQEVARLLKIGKSTVYLMCKKHQIPHVLIGTSVRIPSDLLAEWLKERTIA